MLAAGREMASSLIRGVILLSCTMVLAGCSWFSWLPWVDGDNSDKDATKPSPLVAFTEEVKVDRLWRAGVGDGLGRKYLRLQPALVADRVIAADGYGQVEAHDRFNGKRLWHSEVRQVGGGWLSGLNFIDRRDPSFVSGGVGTGEGLVLLGTTFGEVIALDAGDGSERWRVELGSEVAASPVAASDTVFVRTIDGRLLALNADDGSEIWSFDNQVPVLTLRGTSAPVFDGDIVYSGFANGKVSALRAENGEPIWEHRVMLPEGRSELDRMVDADTSPLVSGSAVFVGAYQGRVKGLSRLDGRPRWEHEISTYHDLTEGYGQVYVVDEEDVVSAIDQQSGEIVWQVEDFKRRGLTAPIAFSNYVVFGDEEGYLHVIAQRDGRHMGRRKIDGKGLRSNMIVADTTLYVLGNSGSLNAIEIEPR